ncbi:hypothetical protein [Xanthomonas dyei]|uniref:hypothetical protein n=1 Tax=Xanthomonas dyei TaxID=743699 RepID=UPI001E584554|nr:hypothetical protein [Xanthomonas dyei]MCC4631987.1 hypothetical protein [Xanthomonas dyei pv. eucalypti]
MENSIKPASSARTNPPLEIPGGSSTVSSGAAGSVEADHRFVALRRPPVSRRSSPSTPAIATARERLERMRQKEHKRLGELKEDATLLISRWGELQSALLQRGDAELARKFEEKQPRLEQIQKELIREMDPNLTADPSSERWEEELELMQMQADTLKRMFENKNPGGFDSIRPALLATLRLGEPRVRR